MRANGTKFIAATAERATSKGDTLIVPLAAKPQPPLEVVAKADQLCDGAIARLLEVQELRDCAGQLAHSAASGKFRRIVVVSLGKAETLSPRNIQQAAASAARWLVAERVHDAAVWIDGLATSSVPNAVAEWMFGMALAGFRFEAYRKPDEGAPAKISVQLRASEKAHTARALPHVQEALRLAEAVNYARGLAHEPANAINPATLAAEARRLAKECGLQCTVLGADKLRQMGAGGLLAVGQGAKEPACLIQLGYHGAPKAKATTVVVGKAITFDTGGYSIKPAQGLEGLKFDKCGGVSVMGILKAVAALKLHCNVVGLIAAAENAVSDKAYRPGDILKMLSGKTVEVISTDAEGRLVLADALTYAQQKLKPTALIDIATLTGGVGIALGRAAAGLMSNDDALAGDLGEAGRRTNERLWRLPLWDDYKELIKSTEADIRNSAARREAHAITGGMFLKEFVADTTPWAHLDIAAVSTNDTNGGACGKGATGFGVRLVVDFLRACAG